MIKQGKTFRFRLYSIFIMSILVPIILSTIFFSAYYYGIMIKQEQQNIEHVLNSISKNMEIQFSELMNMGSTYHMQKEIFQEIELLNNPRLYDYYDDLMRSQLENNYSTTITKMLYMSNQEVKSIVFFPINTEENKCYYIDKNSSRLQAISYNGYEEEKWFLQALEANGKSIFFPNHNPVYSKAGKEEMVYSCVRVIKDMHNKKDIGVIKIDASLKNLYDSIDVLHDNSKDGFIISSNENILIKSDSLPKNIKLGDKEKEYISVGGKMYYQKSIVLPSSGWRLTYLFSMDTFLRSLLFGFLFVFIIVILAICMAFIIYRKNSRGIIEDVSKITSVLKEVQKGNLETSVTINTQSELNDIAEAINKMVYNLKYYIEQKYIMVIKQQKAEFMALQSQVNPHFLYNTLNGFIGLNRMGEKDKLEKSIINLTHMFRYTCTDNDVATISEEIDFIKEYLALEKLKYEERLEYIIWMDDKCASKDIPKLLLQPIVENSIIHGMGDTEEPIMITITVHEKDVQGIGKVTLISVRDNGVGYNYKEVISGKEHVGIENTKSRIELYFESAIYQSTSVPGEGTKTTFAFTEE